MLALKGVTGQPGRSFDNLRFYSVLYRVRPLPSAEALAIVRRESTDGWSSKDAHSKDDRAGHAVRARGAPHDRRDEPLLPFNGSLTWDDARPRKGPITVGMGVRGVGRRVSKVRVEKG